MLSAKTRLGASFVQFAARSREFSNLIFRPSEVQISSRYHAHGSTCWQVISHVPPRRRELRAFRQACFSFEAQLGFIFTTVAMRECQEIPRLSLPEISCHSTSREIPLPIMFEYTDTQSATWIFGIIWNTRFGCLTCRWYSVDTSCELAATSALNRAGSRWEESKVRMNGWPILYLWNPLLKNGRCGFFSEFVICWELGAIPERIVRCQFGPSATDSSQVQRPSKL
jgi:hypothetical protein